jgi:hypothetical protein
LEIILEGEEVLNEELHSLYAVRKVKQWGYNVLMLKKCGWKWSWLRLNPNISLKGLKIFSVRADSSRPPI